MLVFLDFLNSQLGVILVSAILGAGISSVGWLIKIRVERRRDRLEFVRARSENRKSGYEKLMAAACALQFRIADVFLQGEDDASDFEKLGSRVGVVLEDAVTEVRENLVETEPFDKVMEYFHWLFISDHSPMENPGIDEFERLRDLLVKCERVSLTHEKESVLIVDRSLDENNERKQLMDSAKQKAVDQHGNVFLTLSGDDLADWIENYPQEIDRWKLCRDQCWIKMQTSGLFEEDLPPRA